jgi:hypothetical protein
LETTLSLSVYPTSTPTPPAFISTSDMPSPLASATLLYRAFRRPLKPTSMILQTS